MDNQEKEILKKVRDKMLNLMETLKKNQEIVETYPTLNKELLKIWLDLDYRYKNWKD